MLWNWSILEETKGSFDHQSEESSLFFQIRTRLTNVKCLSLNASCSSNASSDSSCSRGSTGRISGRSFTPKHIQRKLEKVEKVVTDTDGGSATTADTSPAKKRCAWVMLNMGMLFPTIFVE